jgi:16S rRNA G1207 methylase RsmC
MSRTKKELDRQIAALCKQTGWDEDIFYTYGKNMGFDQLEKAIEDYIGEYHLNDRDIRLIEPAFITMVSSRDTLYAFRM